MRIQHRGPPAAIGMHTPKKSAPRPRYWAIAAPVGRIIAHEARCGSSNWIRGMGTESGPASIHACNGGSAPHAGTPLLHGAPLTPAPNPLPLPTRSSQLPDPWLPARSWLPLLSPLELPVRLARRARRTGRMPSPRLWPLAPPRRLRPPRSSLVGAHLTSTGLWLLGQRDRREGMEERRVQAPGVSSLEVEKGLSWVC